MGADLPTLYARIAALLERSHAEASSPALWPEVADVLSDGYAHALALESDRLQHRRRAEELAAQPGSGERAGEILSLLQLATALGEELRRLRSLLSTLRTHAAPPSRAVGA
jgi:hypothetical protein